MKYAFLIYQPEAFDAKALSKEEHAAIAAEYQAITGTPHLTPGLPLGMPQQAITVRGRDGNAVVQSGPYMGAIGAIGGYMIYEAETQEQALELAARIPAVRLGGAVEVRPCEVYW